MEYMFLNSLNFNQDLSLWCVTNIASEPTDFAFESPLTDANKPDWGTCKEEFTASLPGPHEGWRMITSPIINTPFADLLSNIYTQGFPGSDNPDATNSNVFIFFDDYWFPLDISWVTEPGYGFIVYVFEDDDNDGTPDSWPKTLQARGNAPDAAVPVSLSSRQEGWHVVANPYPFPISWPQIVAGSGLSNTYETIFVLDPNANNGAGGYRSNPGFETSGAMLHDGIIPPFQGFWIRVEGNQDGQIIFDPAQEAAADGTLFSAPEAPPHLVLSVEGEGLAGSAVLRFDPDEEQQIALPQPLSQPAISFGFSGDELLAQRSLNMEPGEMRSLPLSFGAVAQGTYTFSAAGHEGWEEELELVLIDNATGQEHPLRRSQDYSFDYEPPAKNRAVSLKPDAGGPVPPKPSFTKISENGRFSLRVTKGTTTHLPGQELPQAFRMEQNYPNPFNPETQIRYSLPEAADVQLEVFNLAGQRVGSLVSGRQPAGQHTAVFDASALASGVYLYRIRATSQSGLFTQTLKMSLVK
jgi:hypothetical protein